MRPLMCGASTVARRALLHGSEAFAALGAARQMALASSVLPSPYSSAINSSSFRWGDSSSSSVQIMQLVPQLHHRAMHVRFYRADIQIQKVADFLQAQILVVP